jgi:tetraacyldisaccharide 4'-kinase
VVRAWNTRGPLAVALLPLSWIFGGLAGLRRALWRAGVFKPQRLPCPVVVVGNRIAGGAGKTPTTIAVVSHLQRRGWQVGVVSRGHGRDGSAPVCIDARTPAAVAGDEPLLIARRCGVPVAVGRDRSAAGRLLLSRHPQVDLIVADDGLQHLALARDVEIVVFDERGAGNGWLLPAGPLREAIDAPSMARSQLVLYNAGSPSTTLPGWLGTRRPGGFVLLQDWWEGRPSAPRPAALFDGRGVLAAAGIAVPGRFFDALRAAGLRVEELALPDHHDFATLPWPADTPRVVLTEKDAVKLAPDRPGLAAMEIWVAQLDFELEAGFLAALDAGLPRPPSPN